MSSDELLMSRDVFGRFKRMLWVTGVDLDILSLIHATWTHVLLSVTCTVLSMRIVVACVVTHFLFTLHPTIRFHFV